MIIKLRNSDGEKAGIIRVIDSCSIDEGKCENLTHVKTDLSEEGEITYTLDFLKNKNLSNILIEDLLEEIKIRIRK